MTKPEPEPNNNTADNNNTSKIQSPSKHDAFLSTMTFATDVQRDCDCDECGIRCVIPRPIAEAVRNHKRLKLTSTPSVVRYQERSLVSRSEEGISVWKWILPQGAEPIIEYGNSHRIVFVDTISNRSKIRSIGKGILGSSEEEKTRQEVDWKQGHAYIIQCNGGKALGWIHEKSALSPNTKHNKEAVEEEEEEKTSKDRSSTITGKNGDDTADVILYMIKVTPKMLLANNTPKKDLQHKIPDWVKRSFTIFNKVLKTKKNSTNGGRTSPPQGNNSSDDVIVTDDSSSDDLPFQLSMDDCLVLKGLVSSLVDCNTQ